MKRSLKEVRATVWVWPACITAAAFVVALVLLTVRPDPQQHPWVSSLWPGDSSSASALLQTVATAVMTASTLTFSITIVAIQLASQQFSPRLLRSFARDWLMQAAMALFISAFVVSVTTLRGIDSSQPLPVFGLLLSLLLGLGSAAMIIGFISHMVRRLRVDNMMSAVHHDTVARLEEAYPPYGLGPEDPPKDLPGPSGGVMIPAWDSGFVRTIEPGPLVNAAAHHDFFLQLEVRPGDSVVRGTPLATMFAGPPDQNLIDAAVETLRSAVHLGSERTEEQDVAYGLRQLVDIAIKAISPAVNDPTTAGEALGYCADLLVRLLGRRLGPQVQRDSDGVARVVLPDRDIRYYLNLTCAQTRRFGRDEPTVLTALLRLLRDVAVNTRNNDQRRAIAEQVSLVWADTSPDLLQEDAATVRDFTCRVEQALSLDVESRQEAFQDRAGETRSI